MMNRNLNDTCKKIKKHSKTKQNACTLTKIELNLIKQNSENQLQQKNTKITYRKATKVKKK